MCIKVREADLLPRGGVVLLLRGAANVFPRMKHPWAVAGYTGKLAGEWGTFLGWPLEIVNRPGKVPGHQKTPPHDAWRCPLDSWCSNRLWVVERTFAGPWKSRRMVEDYEALPETAEHPIYEVMVRRLANGLP